MSHAYDEETYIIGDHGPQEVPPIPKRLPPNVERLYDYCLACGDVLDVSWPRPHPEWGDPDLLYVLCRNCGQEQVYNA